MKTLCKFGAIAACLFVLAGCADTYGAYGYGNNCCNPCYGNACYHTYTTTCNTCHQHHCNSCAG